MDDPVFGTVCEISIAFPGDTGGKYAIVNQREVAGKNGAKMTSFTIKVMEWSGESECVKEVVITEDNADND
jgi:hypothetical protein